MMIEQCILKFSSSIITTIVQNSLANTFAFSDFNSSPKMNAGIEKYISMVLADEHKLHIANKVKLYYQIALQEGKIVKPH